MAARISRRGCVSMRQLKATTLGWRRRAGLVAFLAMLLATLTCVPGRASGPSGRLAGVLKFASAVDAGGVAGGLCWASRAPLPVRIDGAALVADPGSFAPQAALAVFDGPFRLGQGAAGPDGSACVGLSSAPSGRPVAVVQSATPVSSTWVPYTWRKLSAGPAGRFRPGLAFAGGKVCLFGGSAYGALPAGQVWCVYDPAAGAWSYPSAPVLPPQRYGHAMAASPDGALWVFGGDLGFRCYPPEFGSDLWRYAAGRGWERLQVSGGPSARAWTRGVWLDGKFWVFGGYGGGTLNDLWAYDPVPGAWGQKAVSASPKPGPRYVHAMAACGGKIYVHGGCPAWGSAGTPLQDLWEYDPASDAWTRRSDGPALYDHEMVAAGGLLYLFGGGTSSSGSTAADVWVYDPARDVWTRLDARGTWPAGRCSHAMCAGPDGSICVFGAYQTGVWQEFWALEPGFAAPVP